MAARIFLVSTLCVAVHTASDSVASGASEEAEPVLYRCEGFESPLSARFETVPQPVVTLSWEDETRALPQAPAASGARYAGADAQGAVVEFWTKGDTAMLTLPGGQSHACQRDEKG